ncbi:MAG: TonB family protein [Gammaproteobacteria bacterium]|nr:TonB family protein [Gammaproteobacteria bacterium]
MSEACEPAQRASLLVINGDAGSRRALETALAGRFRLQFAAAAAEALKIAASEPVDVLVTDHRLSGMSCRQLLRQLAECSPRTLSVVMADPEDTVATASAVNDANVFCVLNKPCPLSEFTETLELAVQAQRSGPTAGGDGDDPLGASGVHALLESSTVAMVVLSADDGLVGTIATSAGERYPLHRAADESQLLTLLAREAPGVLVIDAAACQEVAQVAARVQRYQPSLAIIIATDRADAAALLGLVGQHGVLRVLLKPISPGQSRLCVEAAARRHVELLDSAGPMQPEPGGEDHAPRGRRLGLWSGAGAALVLICAGALWLFSGSQRVDPAQPAVSVPVPSEAVGPAPTPVAKPAESVMPSPTTRQDTIPTSLAAAEAALLAGHLLGPDGDSAESLFRGLLAEDPGNGTARLGLERVWLAVLAEAERALAEGDTNRAELWLESLAERVPGHPRLALVRRQLAAQLRVAAPPPPAAVPAQTDSAAAANADAVVIPPAGADEIATADDAAAASIIIELLDEARRRLRAEDFSQARTQLALAAELGAGPDQLGLAETELVAAETAARLRTNRQLLQLAQDRMEQGRLLEPVTDSAGYYLAAVRDTDPESPALFIAEQRLARALLVRGAEAREAGELDAAQRLIDSAAALGVVPAELAQAQTALARQRDIVAARENVVAEGELVRLEYRAPDYPRRAFRLQQEGWVELEFTVGPDGRPQEIVVTNTDEGSDGVFNDNAIAALERWLYEPVTVDGRYVPQRARVRLRFEIR